MSLSFKWQRYSISLEDYKTIMELTDEKGKTKNNTISHTTSETILVENIKPKYEKAYEAAEKIRQFEIELFWKRATFFWAFIVAIYTAYYHVLTKIYAVESNNITHYSHGTMPLLVLSALGLFFCFSWLLSSKGSKHWQENWEKHLDLLEDKVTGPLYKTYEAGKAYSESKITIVAGWVVTICAYGLLIYEFTELLLCKAKLGKSLALCFCVLGFAIVIAVCLFGYSVLVTGNTSSGDEFTFHTKIFED